MAPDPDGRPPLYPGTGSRLRFPYPLIGKNAHRILNRLYKNDPKLYKANDY